MLSVSASSPSCGGWTANSNVGWIGIQSVVHDANGGGTVNYMVGASDGTYRNSTNAMTVAGKAVTVTQTAR